MSLSSKQRKAILLVGLILGSGVAVAANSYFDESVSGDVTMQAYSGPNVTVTGASNLSASDVIGPNNVTIRSESGGNVTFNSDADANVTIAVDNITGTWTRVSGLDVVGTNLTVNPEDKTKAAVGGYANRFEFTEPTVGDGSADVVWAGTSNHTYITLHGLPSDDAIGLYENGKIVAAGTTSNSGTITYKVSNSEHTASLQESEGGPQFDSSTASPTGDQSTEPEELKINVSDPDFDEGDSVNVTFYLYNNSTGNYENVGSETLTSAGTANTSIKSKNLESGTNKWYAKAVDEFDQSTKSQTFEFGVPGTLYIRNESDPDSLINNTTVTVTVYEGDGDRVFKRSVSDGTVDLSNLPAGQRLIIQASAENYFDRRVVIEQLSQQSSIYLLNKSVNSVQVRFKLDDQTGNYPPGETVLKVRKPINLSGDLKYRTIAADEFGVNGFTVNLEDNGRYRLEIENSDGDTRVLGSFTATVNETVTLTVGELSFDTQAKSDTYEWDATYDNGSTSYVRFNFTDPKSQTENLHIVIYERGNRSNEIYEETHNGPFGEFGLVEPVPSGYENATWVVKWDADRNGSTINGERPVGPNISPGIPLDNTWKSAGSMFIIVLLGSIFGRFRAEAGAFTVCFVSGMFWYIDWLPAEIGAGVIFLGMAITVIWVSSKSRGVPP